MAKNNNKSKGRWYPSADGERDHNNKGMKRINNLFQKICTMENLELADSIARKRKRNTQGVLTHDKNREANLVELQNMLINGTYQTGEYDTFKIFEPKERIVYKLKYYPHRILHHAIMNHLEPVFTAMFTADTYSCIKGKGIHAAANAVKKALKDGTGTEYCLKLDITKFYPSVDHEILKQILRRKFKDADLLNLLYGIIDSATGLPIGNYLSQYFANLYLTRFDHWLKETKRVKYYFRYADDLVFLSDSKEYLHQLFNDIQAYLQQELKLLVKPNYQVFPVDARSIDFVGYRFFHTHTLLRKSIKQAFARMIARRKNKASIASYYGWAKHCNSRHLIKKLLPNESNKFRRIGDRTANNKLCG